jgi:alpha-beta hydrolase superfamily lysophospholipase
VRTLVRFLLGLGLLVTATFCVAMWLVLSPAPSSGDPRDVFGFAALAAVPRNPDLPPLKRYRTRDRAMLGYRLYPSSAERILIFVHGSSYHSAGYDELATQIGRAGAATVVMPNLRGHYQSGHRRGDVDYIGQLEDDLRDLIEFLRGRDLRGPITLGGHSSGGGLAIRFAGGAHADLVSSYLLLSPLIPASPTVKDGTAGGWARLHRRRLFGLLALNALGIQGLNALPIIAFNKPEKYWDGTETLTYSYRLNSSYHPRANYRLDLEAIARKPLLVAIGADDEAIDPGALEALLDEAAPTGELAILPDVNHFGVFSDPLALERITSWLLRLH